MNTLGIVVAVLASLFAGMGLCSLGVFCYFMLQGMKSLQQSAKEVVTAVAIVNKFESVAERNFGENSPTARASKAVSKLADAVPLIVGGMDSFSKTMDVFYKAAFEQDKVEQTSRRAPAAPVGEFTGMIAYSEEEAAKLERERAAKSQRVELSKDEMAGMRTDEEPPEEVPEAETPTS